MTGDFLTKPNQGSIFNKFRDLIVRSMPKTDPIGVKQGNRKKNKTKKSKQE